MTIQIYQYPGCSTCKAALKWLRAEGLEHSTVHIVEEPPSAEQLRGLWQRSGLPLKKFFNTAGQSYRKGDFKSRLPQMTEQQQLEALAADGKLIKRPLVDTGSYVLVGFKSSDWLASPLKQR
jgi:arsenate reductase (glutaredoxin)